MNTTKHAASRSQQRGIPPIIIDLLLQFGARQHAGDGAEICYFDRRARKHLHSYAGGLISRLSEALDAYAVVAGDKVVTVGLRYKHINHP